MYVNDLLSDLVCPGFAFADDIKVVGDPRDHQLQEDLERVKLWTTTWDMPLNAHKCKLLGRAEAATTPRHLDDVEPRTIENVTEIRYLGIQMGATFTPSLQCVSAAAKANRALMQLPRTVESRDRVVIVPFYKTFVRPHLEYCVQAWSPSLVRDTKILEAVQRRFTRMVSDLTGLTYEERLESLKLFSLGRRRCRGDLIEAFKQLKGFSNPGEHLLHRTSQGHLRGHSVKLEKPRAGSTLRLPCHQLLEQATTGSCRRTDRTCFQTKAGRSLA